MLNEVWKPVTGYENKYEVSNFGNVRSLERKASCHTFFERNVPARILKKILKSSGYEQVTLSKDGKQALHLVHRLVANSFIKNPSDRPFINHIDGNKSNNKVTNLEWCTNSENIKHSYDVLGNKAWNKDVYGEKSPSSKRVMQLDMSGNIVKVWGCASDAVRECGFDSGSISRAAHGQYKTHKGYRWEYA